MTNAIYKPPFIADIVRRLAPKLGATYYIEPEFNRFGYIDFPSGRRTFFSDNRFDINTHAAIRVAQDKSICSHILRQLGYTVPAQITFWQKRAFRSAPERRNIDTAIDFAEKIGWPIFIKPNDRSQGRAVSKVWNALELRRAAELVFATTSVAIAQEACAGRDYRLVILDGNLIQAYERVPLTVIGDGKSTISELLAEKQNAFRSTGRETTIRFTPAMEQQLRRVRLRASSVLARRRPVRLTDVSNLSIGGDSIDVTASAHRTARLLGRKIARELNLRFCGIDLMTRDLSKALTFPGSIRGETYRILEVNAAPGLDHYALADERAQARLVDRLYLKLLRAASR